MTKKFEVQMEEWRNAISRSDDIMAALEKLTGQDAAILSLVQAYAKEARNMERAVIRAGCRDDEEMLTAWMEGNKEEIKAESEGN